jgi:CHAT domain-containing protein
LSNLFFPSAFRAELAQVKQLSIVPIRGMSSVPISLLEPLGDGRKVIDLFSVNFLAFFGDLKRGPEEWPREFSRALIVGNPRPSNDREYTFAALTGAEEEARLAHETLGGRLMIGTDVKKNSILEAMHGADLIYFAAHGYSDPSNALDRSFIMLGDGRLTARDVQSLGFHSRPLVVLSACQTGEGYIMDAGVVGLARAFQIAKAQNTVMSLWSVDDTATKILMQRFVQLLKFHPPAEALRRAMLYLRQADPNPGHWSAFNTFGNHAKQ